VQSDVGAPGRFSRYKYGSFDLLREARTVSLPTSRAESALEDVGALRLVLAAAHLLRSNRRSR
jgi:hypothetical protein